MSVLVNCIYCQGYGKKITPRGIFIDCWICDGTRTQAFNPECLRHELRRLNRLSRYNENVHWKSFLMDRITLRDWARRKRETLRQRQVDRSMNQIQASRRRLFQGSLMEKLIELALVEKEKEDLQKPPWEKKNE